MTCFDDMRNLREYLLLFAIIILDFKTDIKSRLNVLLKITTGYRAK